MQKPLVGCLPFFVSSCNNKAYRLAVQLDKNALPPVTLIYGTQGAGKTALLSMMGAELAEQGQEFLLMDAVDFSRRYAYAAQKNLLSSFRRRMRAASVLLCDNLESVRGKAKSLEELLSTCDDIWNRGGHVIATLNMERLALEGFGPRMASRLCLGICAGVMKPSGEEVEAFLQWYGREGRAEKWMAAGYNAAFFEGWHFGRIIRFLEQRPMAADFEPDGAEADEADSTERMYLGNLQEVAEKMMTVARSRFHIGEEELRGPSRKARIVHLRSVHYAILHALGYTQREIAEHYRQGRPSVARGCARVKAEWAAYEEAYEVFWEALVGRH